MAGPGDPNRDLRLERLSDRDGRRPAHLNETALVGAPLAQTGSTREYQAAYQALIDAVFTAPGVVEWLLGLQRAFGPGSNRRNAFRSEQVASDAIQNAEPGPGRA